MSNTLGKLQASLASATNELTVAAATINFDFTLVKCDAPKAFQPLGQLLTPARKRNAETGETHITARRLGALFDGICAATPRLSEAYGTRVAEISKAATDKEPPEYKKSIFAEYAGVDATSIWAAATSSSTSIQVHLLACMLADIWEPAEAVSIWEELVIKRRRGIADRIDQGEAIHFALASAAAQQEISRDKLALWDASARAWIQTAQSVKAKEHKQFELVIKNVDLHVNDKNDLLIGVVEAWKLAIETMERLVGGQPCEIREGAVLLAMSAWHIYPDIHVFGNKNVEIRMNDPLVVQGGIVSVGCRHTDSSSRGIHWSLCLNYLNSYGPFVKKDSSLVKDERFISVQNLVHAAIGSILTVWKVKQSDTRVALEVLVNLYALLPCVDLQFPPSDEMPSWNFCMQTMRTAALECLHDEEALKFLQYGKRRPQFATGPSEEVGSPLKEDQPRSTSLHNPFFGLLEPQTLLRCFPSEECEAARELLYRQADTAIREGWDTVIFNGSDKTAYRGKLSAPGNGDAAKVAWVPQRATMVLGRTPNISPSSLKDTELVYTDDGSIHGFQKWLGDPESVAVYIGETRQQGPGDKRPNTKLHDFLWCLRFGNLSERSIMRGFSLHDSALEVSVTLAYAFRTFKSIPQVKVHIQFLEKPLLSRSWTQEPRRCYRTARIRSVTPERRGSIGRWNDAVLAPSLRWPLIMDDTNQSNQIRMIASLVAGLDIHEIPKRAVGMSTGDSLIVPLKLVRDPAAEPGDNFTRILGNLGQPGFVIFSSPETPVLAPLDEAQWRLRDFHEFDGRSEDMLGATSLHLSFTDWSYPLRTGGDVGSRDARGKLMESVICIRDRGKWIGDVNPHDALTSEIVVRMPEQPPCDHQPHSRPVTDMTAVECWDELMDMPLDELVVVKAHGNWVARLAATAYIVQLAKKQNFERIRRITICPPRVCWACVKPDLPNIYID